MIVRGLCACAVAMAVAACESLRSAHHHAAASRTAVDDVTLARLGVDPREIASASSHVHLDVAGTHVELVVSEGERRLDAAAIQHWVRERARLLHEWLERAPVPYVFVVVRARARARGVGDGFTVGAAVPAIRVALGERADENELARDWVLLHEMVHTALPSLAPRHHWFEEGAAVYVEPCARLLGGAITREQFWSELVRDYGQGAPRAGDGGLDESSSWGRTYYGGATFFLVADLAIRERTRGSKSLRDALAAVVERFGGITTFAALDDVLDAGDRATGTHALRDTYERFARTSEWVELERLWHELGVARAGQGVKFDDRAPKAWLRRTFER